jgi:methionine sulfoxide reductase heme-binding subunit
MPWRRFLLWPHATSLLHGLLSLPFIWLLWALFNDALGANPAEALSRSTGDWTLRFLCLVLAVTPLRHITHTPELIRFRRSLGLATFFYACLHLLCYAWFDQGFELNDIAKDLVKRPFIWLGMLGFVFMLPLALTSSNAALRSLGAKRWRQLHSLVYVLPLFALLHFYWMRAGKNNFAEVWVYACVLGSLLVYRFLRWLQKKFPA